MVFLLSSMFKRCIVNALSSLKGIIEFHNIFLAKFLKDLAICLFFLKFYL